MFSPVDDAIRRGIAFIEATQLPSGELPVLVSGVRDPSLFPTALAAYSLAFVPEASAVRERALDFLESEMEPRGVWRHRARAHPGYDGLVADADDTACASIALRTGGREVPAAAANILLANRARDGRFRTWLPTLADLRKPVALWNLFVRGTAGLRDVDAVVNANVLHFLGRPQNEPAVVEWLLAILRDGRETDCDKWYDDPFAVWYFFARTLAPMSAEACAIIARKVGETVAATALDLALGASALAFCGVAAPMAKLLELQTSCGSWPAAHLYNVGRVRRRDGTFVPGSGDWMTWSSEELTTAFALEALGRQREGSTPTA